MANTYTQRYVQIVFAVQGRQNLITEKNVKHWRNIFLNGMIYCIAPTEQFSIKDSEEECKCKYQIEIISGKDQNDCPGEELPKTIRIREPANSITPRTT